MSDNDLFALICKMLFGAQRDAAEFLGVTPDMLRHWCKGNLRIPARVWRDVLEEIPRHNRRLKSLSIQARKIL